ncbi:MAG: type IV pilus biogenesis/stability protein PilW [Legionella sp.]|nr:type IV pilus biogenesis/stability protein PilW [Legionella sp.]
MRSLCLLSLASLLFLQSCHYNAEEKAEKKALSEKRDDAASYNTQLGMGYLKQGDTPRAKRKLLMAMKLAPDSPEVNGAMAYYLEKTGDTTEAKKYYNKALLLAPKSGSSLNNYGTFLCRSGNYKEAEVYFLKAVKDESYVNSAGAYENAGLCASAIPDYPKAESYFVKALSQDSRRKQSLYELVSIELKQNQPKKALAYLKKHQELVLDNATFLAMAADAAHKAGKFKLEADYKDRIAKLNHITDTGAKNEHVNNG